MFVEWLPEQERGGDLQMGKLVLVILRLCVASRNGQKSIWFPKGAAQTYCSITYFCNKWLRPFSRYTVYKACLEIVQPQIHECIEWER